MTTTQWIWILVIAVLAVALMVIFGTMLLRKPKAPKGGYQHTRDIDDIPSAEGDVLVEERPATTVERPESALGRMARLRGRLSKSNNVFGKGLLALLSRERIDQDVWDEIEDTLLMADLGTDASLELVENLQKRVRVEGTQDPAHVKAMLREELLQLVDPAMDRTINSVGAPGKPAVVLVVGVNGVGKTTTVGKLARVLVAEDKDVLLGAADTFRAAAADQLETWGARVGVATVRSEHEGADPASVAFDAVQAGIDQESDVVLIDTAGRLQNKAGLMDQLGKIKRVVTKAAEVDEVLLVIDATTGQNGMTQAKVFAEAVNITGIVLTKLDGTAKGGIVVAIQRALGVPVKLIGLGEGPDDLAPFDAEQFVDALLD
ncbi:MULTISPECIES: signal recognition particle-docking protein FtsY [unclassified Candidatus Sulfotelmatobacter]|uniref:signal recognition particle-docking protein FtsY n=1 Tax=unclassified Candidatus Sulfotelmatobacter TaxID=2635724 RepID=UPI002803F254|nr:MULTISPECIES: signal recognition particle-docking protein FtsY [unclassified Candidatus Sulfotelmatobacter]